MARTGMPNVAASVHARLKQTRRPGDDFNLILQKRALRCKLVGSLGNIRLPLQVDIGFGDVVTPDPERCEYPTLLDHPKPVLWAYPRETLIAEKFSAMVRLGERSSRSKDVWDIAALAHDFSFDGPTLRLAVRRTMMQRGEISSDEVAGLQAGYYLDAARQGHWNRWLERVVVHGYRPDTLAEAGGVVRSFLGPVWAAVVRDFAFEMDWPPGGPWRPSSTGVGKGD